MMTACSEGFTFSTTDGSSVRGTKCFIGVEEQPSEVGSNNLVDLSYVNLMPSNATTYLVSVGPTRTTFIRFSHF